MKSVLLKNAAAILFSEKVENVSLFVENGKISEIDRQNKTREADETIDLAGATLFAGFIDIHNHGAVGVDVNNAGSVDLVDLGEFLARNGVTAWLPTLVPDTNKNFRKAIDFIDEVMAVQKNKPAAQVLGVHYEGVFANTLMCGALRKPYFRTFTQGNEIESLPTLETGIHFTTIAPEITNGIALTEKLVEKNWIVSIGHSSADAATLDAARKAGAKHVTHFFNAMTGIHHRDFGVAGWALTNEEVTFDIIADGIHVAPEMLEFACRIKSPDKVSLISDSVSPTGLGDGEFEIWGEKISVTNGKTRNERGSIAGSVITLLDAVRMMLVLGFSDAEVSKMASANPAKLLGIEETRGTIEIGKRADLVALDEQGNVKMVMIDGKICQNRLG